MYMIMRRIQSAPGRLPEILQRGVPVIETINSKFGVDFSVALNIGGDPDVIGISGAFETLGAYQDYRDALMADAELAAEISAVGTLTTATEDRIGQVLLPPGERAAISLLNQARMHTPRIAEAIPLALEVAEFAEAKTGVKTGVVAATTGDRSVVAFVGRYNNLDEAAQSIEMLEADPEYLEFFKRGADLYVDGSLEQTLWQRVL